MPAAEERAFLLRHALRLEYFTVDWNIIEGLIAIAAAVAAGSIALLGFGIDSFIETTSGMVLIWRLKAAKNQMPSPEIERLDRRAHQLVGGSLFLLAAYITFNAIKALLLHERPEPSLIGIMLTTVSMGVMWRLAQAKHRTAIALGSRALEADSFQTTACW
ncbi:MAG: cation transporter [Elusimicrobiota bacterium]